MRKTGTGTPYRAKAATAIPAMTASEVTAFLLAGETGTTEGGASTTGVVAAGGGGGGAGVVVSQSLDQYPGPLGPPYGPPGPWWSPP